MEERNCMTCVHSSPYGGPNNNGCTAWSCEYINKKEAVEAWRKQRKADEQEINE